MITSKEKFSVLAQHIHRYLNEDSFNIKLASVREGLAKALNYNTAASLLSDLPVEFNDDFTARLGAHLHERHKISAKISLFSFPFPEYFPLSDNEKDIVWATLVEGIHNEINGSSYATLSLMMNTGKTPEQLLTQTKPEGFTPNGKGGWFCSKHNYLSEKAKHIAIDPQLLFNESQVTEALSQQIGKGIKPLCFSFWNRRCDKEIQRKAVNLCQTQLFQDDQTLFDVSSFIELPFSRIVDFVQSSNLKLSSQSLNSHSNFRIGLFKPYYARVPFEINESIFDGLVQSFIGQALIPSKNEFSQDEFTQYLWSPLEAIKACPETFQHDKTKFYEAFILSDLFKAEIERFSFEWVKNHPDWNRPLRDLVIIQPKPPIKSESITYNHSSSEYKLNGHAEDGLNIYITPYCRGEDQFDYHENLDFDEYRDDEGKDDFDEAEHRKDLAELVEIGELEAEDVEEMIEEAREVAEEEKSVREYNKPFVAPFAIEHMAVDRNNQKGETEFCFNGHFFPDYELEGINAIGRHADLMDSISADLNSLSRFIRQNVSVFEDLCADVFYITEFILTNKVDVKEMASELERAFGLVGRQLNNCVIIINSEALTDLNYIGAPYESCSVLKNEYEEFVHELCEALESHCESVHYFTA